MAIDIGLIAYNEYCKTLIDSKCDCDLPEWKDIGKFEQDAWRHAACAVLHYIDESRKRMEENPELVG